MFFPPGDGLYGLMYANNNASPKNTIFGSALWMAGIDAGGDLHTAAQTYRQAGVDYMPWPISAPAEERLAWDHMWKITKLEMDAVRQDFADNGQLNNPIPVSVRYWPAKFNTNARGAFNAPLNISFDAAPFVDYNADGVYNVFDGDFPVVYGDEMYWWVFTDSLPIRHGETEGKALGIEVSAMAYAFSNPQDSVLYRTIFTRYEITNKSANSYSGLFLGVFGDLDIGCFNNDYIGCDTIREFYYGYNATPFDSCVSSFGHSFGNKPPVQSVVFLSHELNRFGPPALFFTVNPPPTDVITYRLLQALDENNQYPYNPISGNHEFHYYPSDPGDPSGWSEVSQNNPITDRRALGSTGPHTMQPNETIVFEVAYVVHPNGNLVDGDEFSEVQAEIDQLHQFHGNYHPVAVEEQYPSWSFSVYPNPSMDGFTIDIAGAATIEVFDITGRPMDIELSYDSNRPFVTGLPAGTYIVRVGQNNEYRHQKIMVF